MKEEMLFIGWLAVILMSCGERQYVVVSVDNPDYKPNTVFLGSEDLTSPKFNLLIEKYQLDTIFMGKRMSLNESYYLGNGLNLRLRSTTLAILILAEVMWKECWIWR